MSELKNASDYSTQAYESLRAEAESLRQQVGQENLNQSSVLASRRLDEALLRLDRAVGRKRDDGRSLAAGKMTVRRETADTNHESFSQRPASDRTSDLELDESIQQSSAMWFEANDEVRTRYRFDEPDAEMQTPPTRPRGSANRPATTPSDPPAESHQSDQVDPPPAAPEIPVSLPDATASDGWAMLFSSPIDVMISTPNDPTQPDPVELKEQSEAAGRLEPTATLNPAEKLKPTGKERIEATETLAATKQEPTEQEPTQQEPTEQEPIEPIPKAEPIAAAPPHASTIALELFRPTWQVDEFVVPSTVDELFLGGSIAEQLASRLAAARQDGLRTIAVTSTKSGEGRSTVALGMAMSVAFSGLKVAIVDADPRGVRLATDLQLDLDHSWLDSVREHLPLEEAAVHSNADALTLIPLLNRDDEPVMDYTDLRLLLRRLKTCFDLVVVDCGVSAFAEAGLCDTALIVRDIHRTKALEVETLAMSLRRSGVQGVGVVENFCPG